MVVVDNLLRVFYGHFKIVSFFDPAALVEFRHNLLGIFLQLFFPIPETLFINEYLLLPFLNCHISGIQLAVNQLETVVHNSNLVLANLKLMKQFSVVLN